MRIVVALAATAALALPAASKSDSDPIGIAYLCSAEKRIDPKGPKALTLMPGMGSGGFTVATTNPQAQIWFDYGIKLYHGFYHDEAKLAFDKAAEFDPACAMCVWGQALAHGSTMNYDAQADGITKARAFGDKAVSLAAGETAKNKALITAMQGRYVGKDGDNAGYAKAMAAIAASYPDDKEIAVLDVHAALLEAARKNNFNSVQGSVAELERVLAKHPDDTAAIHYYIHATEFVGSAPKALPYASKLAGLAPNASHLVHMAAHTFMHAGLYEQVAVTNAAAIATDARFDTQMGYKRAPGEAFYYGHNYSFGMAGAVMAGDHDLAVKYVDHATIAFPASFAAKRRAGMIARTYMVIGRLEPARALALPDVPSDTFMLKLMRHYARGEAFASKGDAAGIRAESKAIDAIDLKGADDQQKAMTKLAGLVLDGRALMAENNPRKAARVFEKAARFQEKTFADAFDPPPWWYPIRRSVAAAEVKAGRFKDAVADAQSSLAGWPQDALALRVLSEAERGLGQADKADTDIATAKGLWHGDLAKVSGDLI